MADSDIRRRSVTKNDVGDKFGSVVHWVLNYLPTQRTGLPAYWSFARDYYLRQILYSEFHDFWASSIAIAITQMSSLAWELESDAEETRDQFQEMLLAADDNQSWVKFLSRHLQDFLCTDNGAFIEIVRASTGAGSKILGLMHLDSLRCTRTGDPDVPVLYRDTKGIVHEVKAHQVLAFSDMPSPTETYHGVGLCATSRAWGAIKKFEAIERFTYEKVSGERALALDLLGGVLQKDIETGVQSAKEDNEARGNSTYLGSVLIPVPSDVPLSHVRINFAELPDGFVYQDQINSCILTYANAIGLDVQDLQPLTGRPLGTATQSEVLQDKSTGKGLAAWRQQFTHMVNQFVLPDSVTFAFSEKDMRDQQRQADLNKTLGDGVTGLVTAGILTTQQAAVVLADNDVIPQEFVPDDTTPREAIADTEKPEVEQAAQSQAAQPQPQPQQPPQPEKTEKAARPGERELATFYAALAEFKSARNEPPPAQPQPLTIPMTVNVHPPTVNVDIAQPAVNVTNDVKPAPVNPTPLSVNNEFTLPELKQADAPVVNVTVDVPPQPAPVVNNAVTVTPNVTIAEQEAETEVVERDALGRVARIVKQIRTRLETR